MYKLPSAILFGGMLAVRLQSNPHRGAGNAPPRWPHVVVGVVAVVAVVSVTSALAVWTSQPAAGGGRTLGPFVITQNETTSLSFANCTTVTTHWNVTSGGTANFSVYVVGYYQSPAGCPTPPPPENVSACQIWNCPPDYGRTFLCLEYGMSGECSFESPESSYPFTYEFGLYGSSAYWQSSADEAVTFTLFEK